MTDLVYLACPYTHDDPLVRQNRFMAANGMAARLLHRGIMVFSPITHSHLLAAYGFPPGWDYWEPWGREYLAVCKAMVLLRLPGWEDSIGVRAEMEIMCEADKPIYFVDHDGPIDEVVESLKAA